MKVKYIIAMACLGLILNACGKSSSDNNGTPQVKTVDNGDLSSDCVVGQTSLNQTCQQIDTQANDVGFGQYNQSAQPQWGTNYQDQSQNGNYQGQNQNSNYQGQNSGNQYNNDFAGASGLCGCDYGFQPTYVYSDGYGVMKCIRETSQKTSQGVLHFSYDVRSKKKANGDRVIQDDWQTSFDFTEVTTNDEVIKSPSGNNCYQSGPISCVYSNQYNSCGGMTDSYGRPVPASCVPDQSGRGFCVKQSF